MKPQKIIHFSRPFFNSFTGNDMNLGKSRRADCGHWLGGGNLAYSETLEEVTCNCCLRQELIRQSKRELGY